jgi:hypothetical protein
MAFDLSTLLGCSVRDSRLRDVSEYFEEAPAVSERETDVDDRYYLEFFRSGFSLLVSSADTIDAIHIHTQPDDEYHVCTDALPFGLTCNTTQAQARELFGPPTTVGGPVRAILSPETFTYWDRWEYDHYFFHLTYSEHRDSITGIAFSAIPTSASNEPGNA